MSSYGGRGGAGRPNAGESMIDCPHIRQAAEQLGRAMTVAVDALGDVGYLAISETLVPLAESDEHGLTVAGMRYLAAALEACAEVAAR